MRPKVLIILLLAGAAGVTAIFLLKPSGNRPATKVIAVAEPAGTSHATNAAAAVPQTIPPASIPVTVASSASLRAAAPTNTAASAEDARVQAKVERLGELGANYDAESLREILAELTDTNPIIRHAAIDATTQFRDRAAIPTLENLAARTTDPAEKQELIDAAEYLKLPTYTEVMQAKQRAKAQSTGNP